MALNDFLPFPRMKRLLLPLLLLAALGPLYAADSARPNVVIIVTDDHGYAELGATGNPVIHTPHIDQLAKQSAWLTNYHVMPVCSPTRACLMTGRYNYRTGVVDTFQGRSMMHPDETTLAQMLGSAGYRTGIFGKWHLGDNYPMRPMDKGFQQSLVLNGGGLAQPGDPPDPADERGAYFNATLRRNGEWEKTNGYVSDVITTAAIDFIQKQRSEPFFVYLPFNCPHSPHQVPDQYREHYKPEDFNPERYPQKGHPMAPKRNPEELARVYGMIENIDDNVGRLLTKLDELKLAENTIVIFFSDNGCQQHGGYQAGMRGWKGTTYEGGIKQFCFLRWPAKLTPERKVDRLSAHIDLAPTLLDFCGVSAPAKVKFDGRSLAPLLLGQQTEWPDRTLFFQWHRGDTPERYRAFAAVTQDWKLVQSLGVPEKWDGKTKFELFDLAHDPLEEHDLAAEKPEMVAKLKGGYDAWFSDVTSQRDYSSPSKIFLGAKQENPVLLTRQDWRQIAVNTRSNMPGWWEVNVVEEGPYDVKVLFDAPSADGEVVLTCGSESAKTPVKAGATECVLKGVRLPKGAAKLSAKVAAGGGDRGVKYIQLKRQP